jgi:hypothetical protein
MGCLAHGISLADARASMSRGFRLAFNVSLALLFAPSLALADGEEPVHPLSREHPKGEILGALGAAAGSSSWPGDPVGYGTMKIGYRFNDWIAPYFLGRGGYGVVNDRTLLTLSLGVQAWARIGIVRPYARLSVLHQHEESQQAVRNDPFGALFGVGDGIRHRAGGEGALGFEVPIHHGERTTFLVAVEGSTVWFPDPRGPSLYFLGSGALAVNYQLL